MKLLRATAEKNRRERFRNTYITEINMKKIQK
jgi:hypothetical protein